MTVQYDRGAIRGLGWVYLGIVDAMRKLVSRRRSSTMALLLSVGKAHRSWVNFPFVEMSGFIFADAACNAVPGWRGGGLRKLGGAMCGGGA